ncbi:hypothetical protein Goklo_021424 [Gossypium klotzschianum]|uniref:Uncharacterized protein n=1 Tax=Gossypium klotzschianum TaxID=34286 RepID=A0A7J8UV62_9ROSI|nr:hypothetical protein [Gossypium klotzschianum]
MRWHCYWHIPLPRNRRCTCRCHVYQQLGCTDSKMWRRTSMFEFRRLFCLPTECGTPQGGNPFVNPFVKKGIWQSRRIVFDASAIASLKAKIASSSAPYPTLVEVVSALLSKCIMAASKAKSDI